MKRFIQTKIKWLLLLCFFSVMLCCHNNKKAKDNDALQVESNHCDFGKVSKAEHDSIDFSFKLTNCGKEMIALQKVDVSCGCVVVKDVSKSIMPGQSVIVIGKVGIKNANGKFNKPIFLNFSNGQIILLRIVGVVLP